MRRLRLTCGVPLVVGFIACRGGTTTADSSPPDSLFSAASLLYEQLQYDSARAIWELALGRARTLTDSVGSARVLTELGLARWRLGDLSGARRDQEEAVALKLALGLGDSALARSYNGLGLVAWSEGRYPDAAALFESSLASAMAAGDGAGIARATGNAGLVLQELGDLSRARRNARAMREAGQALNDTRMEANGLANEASIDIWEGDPAPAIARLDTAGAMYRRVGYRTGEQNRLGQVATAFALTGEYARAFASLDTSLAMSREQGLLEEEADVLTLLAGMHGHVGDWRRAIRLYDQADSIFREMGFDFERADTRRGAAEAFLALGNLPRARADATAALRLHAQEGERVELLDDLVLLAEIEGRATPRAGARWLDSARVVAEGLGTRGARLTLALASARAHERSESFSAVLGTLRAATPDLLPEDHWAWWEANALAARAHERAGAIDSAAFYARRAVAAVERARSTIASEPLRATFVGERSDVYGQLVLILLRQGRIDESFAVADAARSRGLLDNLAAARRGRVLGDLAQGQELLARIDLLVARLRETASLTFRERAGRVDPATESLARELEATRAEYEALLRRSEDRQGRALAILGGTTVRLDDVRAALAVDELLLEYLVTSDRLIVFAVRRDGLRVLDVPTSGLTLGYAAGLLRDLWGRADGEWRYGLPASRSLHRALIQPVRRAGLLDGIRSVTVVPHGALGQLPFAALQDEDTGRFLVEDYAVAYLASAAVLPALRAAPERRPLELDGYVFAPFPVELPATSGEAIAFREVLTRSHEYRGAQATEAALRRALESGKPVHVATHGVLNARNPMFSRLEVARPRGRVAAEDDGRLEAHELMGLAVRSPLVFFSGCETGAGRFWTDDPTRGSGDHTLAQAVLSAGATNVISTLWRIDDAGAAEFARRFYTELARKPVSESLAAAQRGMAADARYGSPYFWAGYTLSGEGRYGGAQGGSLASVPDYPEGDGSPSPLAPRHSS